MPGKVKILLLLILLPGWLTLPAFSQRRIAHPAASSRTINELRPVMTRAGMVFNCDRQSGGISNTVDMNGDPKFDMYISEYKGDNNWGTPRLFAPELRTDNNEGSISFNFREDFAVLDMSYQREAPGNVRGGNPRTGLFFTYFDSTWSEPVPYPHNNEAFSMIHPSINPIGDVLYFASDIPGGFGGMDLYVSRLENGEWTEPKNLGPVVNTSENEIYPFIHPSGRLYFTSSGHDNRSDYDIFYTDFFEGKWFNPVKLGAPYNSIRNDYGYFCNEDYTSGFYVSDARGTKDIYTFEITLPDFDMCKQQVEDNYCYLFYEENTITLDTGMYVYEWNLGDGTKIMATEAEHCYKGPGDYLVELNVVDKITGTVEFNQAEYMVEVRKVVQPYISCPDTAIVNQEIQLFGTNSYIGDIKPGEYVWDYGDGEKEVGGTTRHIYRTPGRFTIKLGIIEDIADDQEREARKFCSYKTIIVKEN